MLNMPTCGISICSRKFPISIFSSCFFFLRLNMPRLICTDFLLGWLQTKLPLTPQPARKWFGTKDSKMSSSPPTSPQTNSTGMRSERKPPPTRPWIHLPTSVPIQREGWAREQGLLGGQAEFWGRTTLQDLTGLCQPSASLCLSHNGATQTEQPRSVVPPSPRAPSLQMLIVLQHPVTRLHKKGCWFSHEPEQPHCTQVCDQLVLSAHQKPSQS